MTRPPIGETEGTKTAAEPLGRSWSRPKPGQQQGLRNGE